MPAVASLSSPLNLFLLGSGSVATHLGRALGQAGHRILGVYSRQPMHAAALAADFEGAVATSSLDFTAWPPAALYLVCITDAAVPGLMAQARFPAGSVVAHTSGSLPLAVLAINPQIKPAVCYPIQTFSKNVVPDLAQTPVAVEAGDPETAALVRGLAATISSQVLTLSSDARQYLHLAAVFACNFTNHLLGIGQELMLQHQLPPDLLHPLIQGTVGKALTHSPFQVQTGPAVRGDENILHRQLDLLQDQPDYREIYALLSESIRQKRDRGPWNAA